MTDHEKKAQRCIDRAKAVMGTGWYQIGIEVQWGLICSQIVGLIDAQDDETSDTAKMKLFKDVLEFCLAQRSKNI